MEKSSSKEFQLKFKNGTVNQSTLPIHLQSEAQRFRFWGNPSTDELKSSLNGIKNGSFYSVVETANEGVFAVKESNRY